ncbi:MAG: AAA family ATPase [Butyrivibrio sp.]|nr:AAA family ATPase [Butyrivibrio sp.]
MNINEAKEEVKNAVRAYLEKDDAGQYEIPKERQRPILLMGPPGIGKTAIMEQIAHELSIGLVSYTITHHTRQSAIGLPMISEKEYGGKKYSVTDYTMSEIIGAVYEQIEKTGVKEGILFLDEINCVSETLAPTMLQFLQYKTFGSHRIPDGYIIVTAGNPPQYNKSVREFDIVTLDRVRQINIEEDFDAWKDYAYKTGICGVIMAYLEIKKDNFYSIKTDVGGRSFVTARGWEDLSRVIKVHEKLGIPVDEKLTVQYLQNPEVARDFATYYELYKKYNELYRIPDILDGRFPEDKKSMKDGSFDEKLSIIGLLVERLMEEFRKYAGAKAQQKIVFEEIKKLGTYLDAQGEYNNASTSSENELKSALSSQNSQTEGNGDSVPSGGPSHFALNNGSSSDKHLPSGWLLDRAAQIEQETSEKAAAGLLSREDERNRRKAVAALRGCAESLKIRGDGDNSFELAKEWFKERESSRQKDIRLTDAHLTNAFAFLDETFGSGDLMSGSQEMVIFLTELSGAYHSLKFVRETGNDAYYRYNRLLLVSDQKQALKEEVEKLLF